MAKSVLNAASSLWRVASSGYAEKLSSSEALVCPRDQRLDKASS